MVSTQPLTTKGVIASLPDSTQPSPRPLKPNRAIRRRPLPRAQGYAILQVTGIVLAHAPTFAGWKTHVLDDYREEQLPALLRQKTKDLADKAKAMNDWPRPPRRWARR